MTELERKTVYENVINRRYRDLQERYEELRSENKALRQTLSAIADVLSRDPARSRILQDCIQRAYNQRSTSDCGENSI